MDERIINSIKVDIDYLNRGIDHNKKALKKRPANEHEKLRNKYIKEIIKVTKNQIKLLENLLKEVE